MRKSVIILLSIIGFAAHSQEGMTFAICLERAMQNNLAIKHAELQQQIGKVQHRSSYGLLLPSIYADAENRNSWGKEIDNDTNLFVNAYLKSYEGTLNAEWNIFNGFLAINSIKLAKRQLESDKSNLQRVRNEVTIDLAQRFITVLYLQDIIAAIKEQIKSSEKQVEIAQLKFDQGVIAESELFKIKSQKASEELNLLTNENLVSENMIALKQLMNIPISEEIFLLKPELELNENVLSVEDQFAMVDAAVKKHPAYQMSIWEEKKMRSELAVARADRYPLLMARFMYRSNYQEDYDDFDQGIPFDVQLDENTSKQIRFYLTIPIFNRFQTHSEIKSTKLAYKQAKIFVQQEYNRLSNEVLQAITNTKTALKKSEASASAFEFAQKSFSADELKFEMGKININELNTSKIIFNNNQAELIRSKYELLFNNALIKFYMGDTFAL